MRGRIAALALLAALGGAAHPEDDGSAAIAAAHASEALALHEAGKDEAALSEALAAISWNPASSDALYLAALLDGQPGPEGKGPWRIKAERLSTALSSDSFELLSPFAARLLLARSYRILGRWVDCLETLAELGADREPAAWLLGMEASAQLGDWDGYYRHLNAALDLWPGDPRLARAWAEGASLRPWNKRDQAVLDRLDAGLELLYGKDPELLVAMARLSADAKERETLLRRYRVQGGRSRASLIELQRYGLEEESVLVGEFISQAGKGDPLYAQEIGQMLSLLSGPGRPLFKEWLSMADIILSGDANRDGLDDSWTSYKGGSLHEWSADADQDGLLELRISFTDGAPSAASGLAGRDGRLDASWRSYPEIEGISYAGEEGSLSLSYGAGSLSLTPLSFSVPWKADGVDLRIAEAASGFALPSRESAILRAQRLKEEGRTASGKPRVRELLLNGGIPLLEETREGAVLVERKEFERGIATLSRIDLDADGDFDALRRYDREGKATSLEADADGDGIVEYKEFYGQIPRKEWDFTADGLMDAAEEKLPDGTVVRWFSSALDGNFDLRLGLKAGRISSVTKAGKALALRREASGRVTWLGEMPFSLGDEIPDEDGVHRRSGKIFHLYHGAGMVYAEIVR